MRAFERIPNPGDIRRRLGMNQSEFWGRIGVTQSGGSRYESGRNMPKPVRELLRLVHLEGIDITKVRGEDVRIAAQLKQSNPTMYARLKQDAKAGKAPRRAAAKRR